jgi:hypothetical protein
MKGGGVYIANGTSATVAFYTFMYNSTFSILSAGSLNGIIIKASLNAGVESPYRSLQSRSAHTPVNQILLKMLLINHNERKDVTFIMPHISKKVTMKPTEVETECNIQINLYNKSVLEPDNLFEAVCPTVIYVLKENNQDAMDADLAYDKIALQKFIYDNTASASDKAILAGCESPSVDELYFIAMELADGFYPLESFVGKNYALYETYALYELTRMHRLGYAHGDFHHANILINPDYPYFDNNSGRALIIDFGRSQKITAEHHGSIHDLLKKELKTYKDPCYWSYLWLSYYMNYNIGWTTKGITDLYSKRHKVNQDFKADNMEVSDYRTYLIDRTSIQSSSKRPSRKTRKTRKSVPTH